MTSLLSYEVSLNNRQPFSDNYRQVNCCLPLNVRNYAVTDITVTRDTPSPLSRAKCLHHTSLALYGQ